MKLATLDIAIIIAYLIGTIMIGFWISKKAKKNLDSYFLGGKTMPWYMLGLSNASGQFDISGTMTMVAWLFLYGLKSAWIPWLWPVWNQIFLMVFLAIWMRKSNVLTGAEWLKTRFGDGMGLKMSHLSVVIFAIIAVVGFTAYAFVGIGKFATTFLPWNIEADTGLFFISSDNMYGLIICGITTLYVIKGGMYSVVFTEVMQFIIMTVACIAVGIVAINMVSAEQIKALVPDGWESLFFSWKLDLQWNNLLPAAQKAVDNGGYEMFTAFMMMAVFRGIFASIAGPVPGYDMQRVLASRTPKEASMMSGIVSLVLYFPRYLMIGGFVLIGLVYFNDLNVANPDGSVDFERVMPEVLMNYIPVGVLGLVLAGLIAAFMSTYAANVNAGPAYIVNDLYKKFLKPNATDKQLVKMSYLSSIAVVVVGIIIGLNIGSVDEQFQWITGSLFGGYAFANAVKWIWWRFNGYGYFWGMISGLAASLAVPKLLPDADFLVSFPVIFGISVVGSLLGCLLTKPDNDEVLIGFYKSVRPWGFWGPIRKKAQEQYPGLKKNTFFVRDMLNSLNGIIWQMTLTVMPLFLLLREWNAFFITLALCIASMALLKFYWYDKLEKSSMIDEYHC